LDSESRSNGAAVTRPHLLLDVDGVLCPLGERGGEELLDGHTPGGAYVRYSPQTAGRLAALSGEFQLVWATAWEAEANQHLAPLFGLPQLPYLRFEDEAGPYESWKLPSIARFVGDKPFAWVDDDIGLDAHEWAASRPAPTLLLEVRGDCGLGSVDGDKLLDFARRVRGTICTRRVRVRGAGK
jgi:hypothetical protein